MKKMLLISELLEMLQEFPPDTPVVLDGRQLNVVEVTTELCTDYYEDGTPVIYIST